MSANEFCQGLSAGAYGHHPTQQAAYSLEYLCVSLSRRGCYKVGNSQKKQCSIFLENTWNFEQKLFGFFLQRNMPLCTPGKKICLFVKKQQVHKFHLLKKPICKTI